VKEYEDWKMIDHSKETDELRLMEAIVHHGIFEMVDLEENFEGY
jgi:hypothetical protein